MLPHFKTLSLVLPQSRSPPHSKINQLHNITELLLRGSGVKDRLASLVGESIRNRLTCLDLAMCQLSRTDMILLSSVSFKFDSLKQLVLSGNDLSRDTSSICLVIRKLKSKLSMLGMSNCQLNDDQSMQVCYIYLFKFYSYCKISAFSNLMVSSKN